MKKFALWMQSLLLLWFFLDMTGLYFGDMCLVTRSYKEDGIFFLVYLTVMIVFILKESVGKWLSFGWLLIWFTMQFLSHEWYTIFGSGCMGSLQGKIRYFSGTVQWLRIEGRYIPDVYHTILHILILSAWIGTAVYIIRSRKRR